MRNVCLALALTFSLLSVSAFAQAPIPETASGRGLEAWLEAFNSGDRARLQAFVDAHGWPQPIDGLAAFRTQTGGFDLVSVERSDAQSIEVMVKERASETRGIGRIVLTGDPPPGR